MNRRNLMKTAAVGALAPIAVGTRTAEADTQAASVLPVARRYRVGAYSVTAISDGFLPIGPENLSGIDEAAYAESLAAAREPGPVALTGVNVFLIETGSETVLVDAGTGSIFGPTLGHLDGTLTALGVAPESIDRVVATHLHPDHIGGLLQDGAIPFTNAGLTTAEAEIAFWTDETIAAGAPEQFQPFFELARNVVAGFGDRLETVSGEADLGPGITAVPMPGHTPGHMGVHVESEGTQLLLWADILHVGPVQFRRPEVTIGFDVDQSAAAETRARVLDMAATDGLWIGGAHIDFPGLGHVERRDQGYGWVPSGYPYGE